MIIAGKLTGAILGIPFGVFGILLGILAGTLVDQVLQMRRNRRDLERFYLEGRFVSRLKRLARPAAAIGLVNRLLSIDDQAGEQLREGILEKISGFFLVRSMDRRRLEQCWDMTERWDHRLDLEWLIRVYGVSSPEYLELSRIYSYGAESERDFLFTLFHGIAGGDELGLSRDEYRFLREVFEPMGLSQREIQQRLRSVPYLNREYCRLLDLDPQCSEGDLKKRYRDLAARLHPDSFMNIGYGDDRVDPEEQKKRQEDFSRLQHAYEELLWQFRYYD